LKSVKDMQTFNTLHRDYRGSPLLGYVHKDLALGSFIVVVLDFLVPCAYSGLQKWVRSMWGKLDRTRLYSLWSNPHIYLPSYLFLLNSLQNSVHTTQNPSHIADSNTRNNHTMKIVIIIKTSIKSTIITTIAITTSYMILSYLYLYISFFLATYRILPKL